MSSINAGLPNQPDKQLGKPILTRDITTPGAFIFTPRDYGSLLRVTLIAGGGGGARGATTAAAGGAGAGAQVIVFLMRAYGPVNGVVGAPGVGATANSTNGTAGGKSSFGGVVAVQGGAGLAAGGAMSGQPDYTNFFGAGSFSGGTGGAGGASGANAGQAGSAAGYFSAAPNLANGSAAGGAAATNAGGGGGGDSFYGLGGAGGAGSATVASPGANATGYGAGGGGGGAGTTSGNGGNGSPGRAIIEDFGA